MIFLFWIQYAADGAAISVINPEKDYRGPGRHEAEKMDNEKIFSATMRFYKKRPVHAQAYRCLKNMNTDIFKSKDDFIAEAVVHFSRYLKQEEDKRRMEEMDACLERQSGKLLELMKKAISQVQSETIPELVKTAFGEAMQGNMLVPAEKEAGSERGGKDIYKEKPKNDYKKDLQFAQFYEMDDD